MAIEPTKPEECGYRFPIEYTRTCDHCENSWQDTIKDRKTICPACNTRTESTVQQVRIGNPDGSIGVDHYTLLSRCLDEQSTHITKLNPQMPEDHHFWAQTLGWLVQNLSKAGWERFDSPADFAWFAPDKSAVDFGRVHIRFDATCDYSDKRQTVIACEAEVDGERVATWRRRIVEGGGMSQTMGEYCALISGLNWASETVAVIREVATHGERPLVTFSGDRDRVTDQLLENTAFKSPHLAPLHRYADELINDLNASYQRIDSASNTVEPLLH